MGLLHRILNWKWDYEEAYEVEEWNEIVYDRDDLQVHNRKQREEYVRGCLEQIAEASREVENLQHEYQVVTSHLKDIEEIEALPENESRLLMECAKRIDTLEGQQSGYKERKNRMTDEKFYQMECMEEEVQEAYEKLEKAEEYQNLIKRDLRRLDSERQVISPYAFVYEIGKRLKNIHGNKSSKTVMRPEIHIRSVLSVAAVELELIGKACAFFESDSDAAFGKHRVDCVSYCLHERFITVVPDGKLCCFRS